MHDLNLCTPYRFGLSTLDSSVWALGGYPYAKQATGDVATEGMVHLLHGLGGATGIDLFRLVDVRPGISRQLAREQHSNVKRSTLAKRSTKPAKQS